MRVGRAYLNDEESLEGGRDDVKDDEAEQRIHAAHAAGEDA